MGAELPPTNNNFKFRDPLLLFNSPFNFFNTLNTNTTIPPPNFFIPLFGSGARNSSLDELFFLKPPQRSSPSPAFNTPLASIFSPSSPTFLHPSRAFELQVNVESRNPLLRKPSNKPKAPLGFSPVPFSPFSLTTPAPSFLSHRSIPPPMFSSYSPLTPFGSPMMQNKNRRGIYSPFHLLSSEPRGMTMRNSRYIGFVPIMKNRKRDYLTRDVPISFLGNKRISVIREQQKSQRRKTYEEQLKKSDKLKMKKYTEKGSYETAYIIDKYKGKGYSDYAKYRAANPTTIDKLQANLSYRINPVVSKIKDIKEEGVGNYLSRIKKKIKGEKVTNPEEELKEYGFSDDAIRGMKLEGESVVGRLKRIKKYENEEEGGKKEKIEEDEEEEDEEEEDEEEDKSDQKE